MLFRPAQQITARTQAVTTMNFSKSLCKPDNDLYKSIVNMIKVIILITFHAIVSFWQTETRHFYIENVKKYLTSKNKIFYC